MIYFTNIIFSGFFVFICQVSHLLTNLDIFLHFSPPPFSTLHNLFVCIPALRCALCNICTLWIIYFFIYTSFRISLQSNILSVENYLLFRHVQLPDLFIVQQLFNFLLNLPFFSNTDFSFLHIFCTRDFFDRCKTLYHFFLLNLELSIFAD